MKHQGYYNRALQANDPRFARVFDKMGYGRSDMAGGDEPATAPQPESHEDELTALRAEYQEAAGKKPYHGWDADTLREKIKAAEAA